jgi:hypothetical protein
MKEAMKKVQRISASKALFIKLGEGGKWEKECIENGLLRLGYQESEHELCKAGNWHKVRDAFGPDANAGAVNRHLKQIQSFYKEPAETLWITFFSDRLWWCFSEQEVFELDGSKTRRVIGKWSDESIQRAKLSKGSLSGKLLAVQGFQGTICTVRELTYLLHKINGTEEPHVAEANAALHSLEAAVIPIIQNLHPKDLETLTDLIFRQAGWRRVGVAGEVVKDIDLHLESPITKEQIAVQVKSTASKATYDSYQSKFQDMWGFSKFYFVTHSPSAHLEDVQTAAADDQFIFWGVEQLAEQAVNNGLVGWLIERAS